MGLGGGAIDEAGLTCPRSAAPVSGWTDIRNTQTQSLLFFQELSLLVINDLVLQAGQKYDCM